MLTKVFSLTGWDVVLICVVSLQAAALAYTRAPRGKAFILTLPFPFTCAAMAVGVQVGINNIVGLLLLLGYANAVRALRDKTRLPIVPAILVSSGAYCLLGGLLAPILPGCEKAFWIASLVVWSVGLLLHLMLPHQDEPGHKTPVPLWLKLLLLSSVAYGIVTMKHFLAGFATTFPMVGVLASYEGRHSLYTMSRQIPVVILTMVPMICAARLAQGMFGLGVALIIAWLVFLIVLMLVSHLGKPSGNWASGP